MLGRLAVLLIAAALACHVAGKGLNGTVYSVIPGQNNHKWTVVEGFEKGAYAWGTYVDTINVTGWGLLELNTNAAFADRDTMFAAGYLESFLTHDLIWANWVNIMQGDVPLPKQIYDFLQENYEWTMASVADESAPQWYWNHVGLVMEQFHGLFEGYKAFAHSSQHLDIVELLSMSANGDLSTLMLKFNISSLPLATEATAHCSALIRVTDDLSDLFFGHTTWAGYTTLLRTYKTYNFALNANGTTAVQMSFSSYPGFLTSSDDFFVMDSGLAVTETTNGNFNYSRFVAVTPSTGVLSWARTLVANRVASSGQGWTEVFALANSETYNNQWIVVDMKLFTPGQPLVPGTLWILEQYPDPDGDGYMTADVTSVLAMGYWASYNVPYFPQINAECGFPEQVALYGPYLFSYELCARAEIFRRNASSVESLEQFQALMRYNNWEHDPFSSGNAGLAISSRFDLVTGAYPNNPSLQKAPFGGLDSKVTNYELMTAGRAAAWIQSGPTHDQQPPFTWANWPSMFHELNPEVFDFGWILVDPATPAMRAQPRAQ